MAYIVTLREGESREFLPGLQVVVRRLRRDSVTLVFADVPPDDVQRAFDAAAGDALGDVDAP